MLLHHLFSGRNVLSRKCSLEHLQGSQGLVERYLVSGFVDSHETVQVALSDLAVNNSVRSGDIDESCILIPRRVDFFRDDLPTKPVAVEVTAMSISAIKAFEGGDLRIAKIHDHLYSSVQQLLHGLDRTRLTIIITCAPKARTNSPRGLREVLISTNGSLNLGAVEVVHIELIWERIGSQLAHIVLVTS